VSANLAALAVGTETDGSIVSPASVCGIVGVKPTVGLVSRAGIIPVSVSQDTAGPMTRTVRDAALLLGSLAGRDPRDAATLAIPEGMSFDFAGAIRPDALRGARIGVLRGPFGFHTRLTEVIDAAIAQLRAGGAEVIDLGEYRNLRKIYAPLLDVLFYEMKDGLDAYLAALGPNARVRSLGDVIRFNDANAATEMAYFGQEFLVRADEKGSLSARAYLDARATTLRLARTEGLDAWFDEHGLDAVVSLTMGAAWPSDPVNGDANVGGSSTLAAVAGYPSVTVPAAQTFGLPIGLSFTGRAWSEARLLSLAADFEARVSARVEPAFLPTVGAVR
jgi:amidase